MDSKILKDLIGIPFVEGGRDPKTGLDCLGLAQIASDRLNKGITAKIYVNESDTEDVKRFASMSMEHWEKIDKPEMGCWVAMKLDSKRPDLIQHLGIYIGNGFILQTMRNRDSHLIRVTDSSFRNKIEGFYKWKQ